MIHREIHLAGGVVTEIQSARHQNPEKGMYEYAMPYRRNAPSGVPLFSSELCVYFIIKAVAGGLTYARSDSACWTSKKVARHGCRLSRVMPQIK